MYKVKFCHQPWLLSQRNGERKNDFFLQNIKSWFKPKEVFCCPICYILHWLRHKRWNVKASQLILIFKSSAATKKKVDREEGFSLDTISLQLLYLVCGNAITGQPRAATKAATADKTEHSLSLTNVFEWQLNTSYELLFPDDILNKQINDALRKVIYCSFEHLLFISDIQNVSGIINLYFKH